MTVFDPQYPPESFPAGAFGPSRAAPRDDPFAGVPALAAADRVEVLCFRPIHHVMEYEALYGRLALLREAAPRAEIRVHLRSAVHAADPFAHLPADRVERLTGRRGRGALAAGVRAFLSGRPSGVPCVLLAPPAGWRRAAREFEVAATAPLDFATSIPRAAAPGAAAFLAALQAESPRWTVAPDAPGEPPPRDCPLVVLLHQARFHLGDALWLTPLLREIRSRFPRAAITVVAPEAARHLLAGHPDLAEFVPYHPRDGEAGRLRVLAALGRRRFDAALFAFARRPESAWLAAAAANCDIPWRIGLEYEDLALDARAPWAPLTHEGWLYWGTMASPRLLLHALDPLLPPAAPGEERFAGPLPADVRVAGSLEDPEIAEPFAVLCPGGFSSRRWPAERFAELAIRLAAGGLHVVVEGGAADAALLDEIAARCAPGRIAVRRDPLPRLAALLSRAALLVANDSAPIHLAEAVATPTLYFAERQKLGHSHPRTPVCWALYDEVANDPAEITVEQALGALREMARRGLLRGVSGGSFLE